MNRAISLTTLLTLMVSLVGCGGGGGSERSQLDVTGKVTFAGAAVTEGTLQFEDSATGLGGSADLGAEGVYSIELPEGNYKVLVTPPMITTPDTESSPGETKAKDVDNIPGKYRTYTTSGLTAAVSGDKVEHDFALTE